MNLGFLCKATVLLGAIMLCLGQGCPSATQTAGHVPDETSNGGDNNGGDDSNNSGGNAGSITIEPDDFEDGEELTEVNAAFTLSTALDDNEIAELFEVTATQDSTGLAPTGDHVFAHHNIPFFNDVRRLRVDFNGSAQSVQITFAGSSIADPEMGVLQAYDANDNLIAEYNTAPLDRGETEVMSVSNGNIAWVVAYTQGSGFGRLDRLVVTVSN